jgi:prepilin-type N-terminal cleavage/methylation domain-containing protein
MTHSYTQPHTKGFTLVETLVAISILTLSILGTFTAVQKSLQSSTFVKDQITAFYLAQESIEYIRNIRDENGLWSLQQVSLGNSGRDWLYGLSGTASDPCYFGKVCTVDIPQRVVSTCSGVGSCPYLNQDSTTGLYGYTSGGSWSQTRFRREVQLTSISSHEAQVAVTVSWVSGSISKSITVREMLNNWQ